MRLFPFRRPSHDSRLRRVLRTTAGLNHCLNDTGTGFDPDKVWAERNQLHLEQNNLTRYVAWRKEQQRRIDNERSG